MVKLKFPSCNATLPNAEMWKMHLANHTGDKSTNNCSTEQFSASTPELHSPYICNYPGCNKRFPNPSSLRKHANGHAARENVCNLFYLNG